jgi:hypothetical protein
LTSVELSHARAGIWALKSIFPRGQSRYVAHTLTPDALGPELIQQIQRLIRSSLFRGKSAWPLGAGALVLVLAGAIFALTAGSSTATHATDARSNDYAGAEHCRSCHQKEFEMWASGPHAKALSSLDKRQRQDPRCRQCHTMVPDDKDPRLAGVQCETCHGPGRWYSPQHVMRDKELASLLYLQNPDEKTCTRCHTDSVPTLKPWNFAEKLPLIRHWEGENAGGSR